MGVLKTIGTIIVVFLVVIAVVFGFSLIGESETNRPWITYDISIPEYNDTATHVKIGVLYRGEGGLNVDFNSGFIPIPENRTMSYKTQFGHIREMFVLVRYFIKTGSGYIQVHQENYIMEMP